MSVQLLGELLHKWHNVWQRKLLHGVVDHSWVGVLQNILQRERGVPVSIFLRDLNSWRRSNKHLREPIALSNQNSVSYGQYFLVVTLQSLCEQGDESVCFGWNCALGFLNTDCMQAFVQCHLKKETS